MYELIICEKPQAAKKIAEALADGKAIKENANGVPYYRITRGKKDIVVVPAVGHLYTLEEIGKKGWSYPVFNIEWVPASVRKESKFTKKYLDAIKKLAKDADSFVVACDYDQEGSLIGKNILALACKQKDAGRMKFSTLTKDDLNEAYEHKSRHLDWGQILAGETRHFLDFYNGINYSRALTSAIKSTGAFKIMSTGRVQGPALKIIVDREKEIRAFKPVPYWQIELEGSVRKENVSAWHKDDKFWDKGKADGVMKNTKGQKTGYVAKVEKNQFHQAPPNPFDLTSLQMEAYKCFGIPPKQTLEIAQELYTAGFISYPRTSSQQLPPAINYKKIMKDMSGQNEYSRLMGELLKLPSLKPNDGKKTDPAHPALYPTGIAPTGINEREMKIYDLIVKRFMATFSRPALRETVTAEIGVNREIFAAKGTRTIDKGWHVFYEPYVKLEEEELPKMENNEKVDIRKITMHDKETQPPKRYTEASIIKELERKNLGTKATRSEIVDTLFHRGYVDGRQIGATELGIKTIETLHEYAPKIIDEDLTRHFEEETEKIMEGKQEKETVLHEAEEAISAIVQDFKKNEKQIGTLLAAANRETVDGLNHLGKCPACGQGDISLRKGKFGHFAACNRYPDCKTTFSLPGNALIKPAKKLCPVCNYPMVMAIKRGKQPREFCLNKECKSKYLEGEAGKEAKEIAKGIIEKKCPKCENGVLVLRSSIYGKFLGCRNFPKCRFTERLEESNSAKAGEEKDD